MPNKSGKCFEFACQRCSFTTKRELKFVDHLQTKHHLQVQDAYDEFINEPRPKCGCGQCDKDAPWCGWKIGYSKFVRGHNARIDSCFGDRKVIERAKITRNSSREAGEWTVWNTGLTKETNESLQQAAKKKSITLRRKYAAGEIIPWQFDESRLDRDASFEKMKKTKKKKYENGEIVNWSAGKTKDTDERLRLSGEKTSKRAIENRHFSKRHTTEKLTKKLLEANYTLVDDTNYRGFASSNEIMVRCNLCQLEQHLPSNKILRMGSCKNCGQAQRDAYFYNFASKAQLAIGEYVSSLGVNCKICSRDIVPPMELDIYVENKKLAIEYDGLYWHSASYDTGWQSKKWEACRAAGINLMRIFEDEWRDKGDIVRSLIAHRLGFDSSTIYARRCELVELKSKASRAFFDATHLEGAVRSNKTFALVHNGEVVAALSLRRPFQRKKYASTLEIARFSTKLNTNIPGALGKLIAAALKHTRELGYDQLISYVDTRLGTGQGYIDLGWKLSHQTTARFWWTDHKNRFNRFMVRADRSAGLTERQVAKQLGVERIPGHPNFVYVVAA